MSTTTRLPQGMKMTYNGQMLSKEVKKKMLYVCYVAREEITFQTNTRATVNMHLARQTTSAHATECKSIWNNTLVRLLGLY